MLFEGRRACLAVDLGHAQVKVLHVDAAGGREGKPRILAIGCQALPPPGDGDRERNAAWPARAQEALGLVLNRLGIHPKREKRVIASLPAGQVAIKRITCMPLPEEELRAALAFEARKHLPVEGEALMDFQVLGKVGEQLDVLLVTTTREAVSRYLGLLEAVGFRKEPHHLIVEAPQLAGLNALQPLGESMSACLHLGAGNSHITLRRDGGTLLCRDIAVGGDRMTEELRQAEGLSFDEAEVLKRRRGLLGMPEAANPDSGASKAPGIQEASGLGLMLETEREAVPASVTTLVREVGRTLRFAQKEDPALRIEKIHVLGGPAADASLLAALRRELALPVAAASPLDGFDAVPDNLENPSAYGLVAGMARRGLHEFLSRQPE